VTDTHTQTHNDGIYCTITVSCGNEYKNTIIVFACIYSKQAAEVLTRDTAQWSHAIIASRDD